MTYERPPVFERRVFNPLAMRFGIAGARALVVPGRSTGQPRKTPVIPVEHEGARYLVSTRGEANWVRNLRAADGRGQLQDKASSEAFLATEVPVEQRPPIIAAYRPTAGKSVDKYFTSLPDPADHPVFRIQPAAG
jgi:deazaflavin-dependent oxidoreductase (nitroreductase family)